jgi:membrane-bound lytic murein transglycosylase MltF
VTLEKVHPKIAVAMDIGEHTEKNETWHKRNSEVII